MLPFVGFEGCLPSEEEEPSEFTTESVPHHHTSSLPENPHAIVRSSYNVPSVPDDLLRDMCVTPRTTSDYGPRPTPFPLYSQVGAYYRLPRTLARERLGQAKKNICNDGAPAFVTGKSTIELREYQTAAVERILHEFQRGAGYDCMLEACCGAGKTVMALNVLARWKKCAAIIVHKDFLLAQWRERIEAFLPDAKIGLVQQNVCDYEGKDIVLCMLHSIVQRRTYPADFFARVGVVVVDECHHIAARTFSLVLRHFPAAHRLGLSATPDRKDGLGRVVNWLLGPVVFRIKRRVTVAAGGTVEVVKHTPTWREVRTRAGKILFTKMITAMVEDEARTALIVQHIVRLVRVARRVLVVSDRRQHLNDMAALLPKSIVHAQYVGETTKTRKRAREEHKSSADVLFTTYGMGEEGLDVKGLDTLVLTTPRKSLEQIVGRILRGNGAHPPKIVDIVDQVSIFIGMGKSRARWFESKGYDVMNFTS